MADALQKNDLTALLKILDFIEQLEGQLRKDYQEMMYNIDNCR
jgi:hypothetical protein